VYIHDVNLIFSSPKMYNRIVILSLVRRSVKSMLLGPATWHCVAPAARGLHQSPVDIKATDVIYDAELNKRPLCIQYDTCCCKTLCNNGRSLQVVADAQDTCKLNFRLFFSLATEHWPGLQAILARHARTHVSRFCHEHDVHPSVRLKRW